MLYFAYTARIAPERMAAISPDASFEFVAHLPEWGIVYPIAGNGWAGGIPTAAPTEGSTVWGVVYTVPETDASTLDAAEQGEGRIQGSVEAIDRTGRRHTVVTHLVAGDVVDRFAPSQDYVRTMLDGSRHWGLPAGWIAGLEEHLGADY